MALHHVWLWKRVIILLSLLVFFPHSIFAFSIRSRDFFNTLVNENITFVNCTLISSVKEKVEKGKSYFTTPEGYLTGMGIQNHRFNKFNKSITIGFITDYNKNQLSLGALQHAVARVNDDPNLLKGRTLEFIAANIQSKSDGSNPYPVRIMSKMMEMGVVAFIGGSEASCSSEALVAAAWNLPMISYKCSDTLPLKKKTYFTFARTLPPSSKIFKSVMGLFKKFDWNKFILITSHRHLDGLNQFVEAAKDLSKENGITLIEHFKIMDYIPGAKANMSNSRRELERIVDQTYKQTRVYLYFGEHITLVALIDALDKRNLLDTGEYIIISLDDKIWDPENDQDYFNTILEKGDFYKSKGLKSNDLQEEEKKKAMNIRMKRIKAFRSVLKLTPSHPQANYSKIEHEIRNFSVKAPFCVPYHPILFEESRVRLPASAYLYDAVMIYAKALSEVLDEGGDPRNGTEIFKKMTNRTFDSIQGYKVLMDENGDAEGNYSVIALMDGTEVSGNESGSSGMNLQLVGYFRQNASSPHALPEFHYFNESRPIQWVGGKPPKSEPKCGFNGEKCLYKPEWTTIIVCSVFASILLGAFALFARHYRYEQKLACLLWKIDMRNVITIPIGPPEPMNGAKSTVALCRQLLGTAVEGEAPLEFTYKRAYTPIGNFSHPKVRFNKLEQLLGFYKGMVVAIKPIYKRNIDLTRTIQKELKQIRELRHENIIPFIGASVETGNICILTAYSARGSLEDVLQNEDLHLDNMFLASLVADLIKGMIYLHDSEIVSHGHLKSSNCLVDSRWVLQISDFGLHDFKEILDRLIHPLRRQGEYEYFRPLTYQLDCSKSILRCLHSTWEEDPELRPDFRFIRVRLKEMQAGLKPNIFDNMLSIMEKYACNLEDLVQERTTQLMEEKKKTDALLHRMLPKSVAEILKRGEPVEAESFDSVTIYFSDIVGFTTLSAGSSPLEVVELLNDLYSCFDSIISNYDVYKVETIGDAYMVVSGLPLRNGNEHAGQVASMALHLLDRIRNFEIRHMPGERLKLRIGIHSGSCVAGVVGTKMPRYCLFGDTVNTASRMESSGEPLRIHISKETKDLLDLIKGYYCEERGLTPIKGKGEMFTYWLSGEDSPKMRKNTIGTAITKANKFKGTINLVPIKTIEDGNSNFPFLNISPRRIKSELKPSEGFPSIVDHNVSSFNGGNNFKPTTWLLAETNKSGKIEELCKNGRYVSCSNVFQECKASIIKELRKNEKSSAARFRSAPIITFMEGNNANMNSQMKQDAPNFV